MKNLISILRIALLAIIAAILFAVQIDDSDRSYIVTRGISFYLQVIIQYIKICVLLKTVEFFHRL